MNPERSARSRSAAYRFACTACGRCCHGSLPLTLADALASAGRFPLAMVWTPVPRTARAFRWTREIGIAIEIDRKPVAVLIAPTAYLPPRFSCPALGSDGLCRIHAEKPLRCRAMPFYAYREEDDQADALRPRQGWACETSDQAPVVYRDRTIIERADFEAERAALVAEAPLLRAYAETLMRQYPMTTECLKHTLRNPRRSGGGCVLEFLPFLRQRRDYDPIQFARAQYPVLEACAARTAEDAALAKYRQYYRESAANLAWFARQASTRTA